MITRLRSKVHRVLSISLCLLLVGCGATETSKAKREAHPDIENLVGAFERAWGHPVTTLVEIKPTTQFQVAANDTEVVGLCVHEDGGPTVYLSGDFWSTASDAQRWVLVFHELGHCALNREHRDDLTLLAGGCPVSIMRWSIMATAYCIETGRRTSLTYEEELFEGKDNMPNPEIL